MALEPAEIGMDEVDGTPASKRQRMSSLSDEPSAPSTPCVPLASIVDTGVEPVSSDVQLEWPGLPSGAKFDPSDEELLWHLLAKVGKVVAEPHPLISEFIISLDEDDKFGYTHPQRLAGVKKDGSVSYFFHRGFKAFDAGDRKCQKTLDADFGVVFWHKIGKIKPVIINGIHEGCKQIMVLYVVMRKGEKPEKTDWVMHQYHLGRGEDDEGEFVASKIFYQQKSRQGDESSNNLNLETTEAVGMEGEAAVDRISPGSKIHTENQHVDLISDEASVQAAKNNNRTEYGEFVKCDSHPDEDPKGGEIELLDSQQHIEGIITHDDLSQTQFSCAEAERITSCMMSARTSEKDVSKCENGESSTRSCNLYSTVDYSSEFTTCEVFKSREAMIKWTRDRGRMNGFVIVIKTSDMGDHGRKQRVIFGCERGGKYRNHNKNKEETKKRSKTSTKKCECPFALRGNKLATDDDWMLVVVCGVHNHPATERLEGNTFAGRLSQEEISLVADLSNSLVPPKDILTILKQRDPLNMATVKTIYNARQKSKRLLKAGRQIDQLTYECVSDPVSSTNN